MLHRSFARWASPWLLVATGCSGGSFEVAGGPGDDTGSATDSGASEGSIDSGIGDATSSDSNLGDVTSSDVPILDGTSGDAIALDGTSCVSLAPDATDIYVDKFATGASMGTAACPFHTIAEATALGATSGTSIRTIHVSGTGPVSPVTYNETSVVHVAGRVILLGAGAFSTRITGAGASFLGYNATVVIDQNAVVDGFSIVNASGSGVVMNTGSLTPGGVPATIKNSTLTGNKEYGIVVGNAAEIGPNVHADGNSKTGLLLIGNNFVHVTSTGGASSFDSNNEIGIFWSSGTGSLQIDGASASNNVTGAGVRLQSTGTVTHRIINLVAKNNATAGLNVTGGNLNLRNSTLTKNKSFGLIFNYGTSGGYTLDIGTTLSSGAGNDIFGAVTSTERNGLAGICLANAGGTGSQAAEGDKWSSCPTPSQVLVSGCDGGGTSYADIWYFQRSGATTPNPVLVTSCGLGP